MNYRALLITSVLLSLLATKSFAKESSVIVAPTIWKHHRLGRVHPRLAVTSRFVILNRDDITVECIDLHTGDEKWRFNSSARLRWPALHGEDQSYQILCGWNYVYVTTMDGALRAIDLETGKEKWVYKPKAPITTPPTATTNILFVQSADSRIHAVNGRTGKKMWTAKTKRRPITPLLASGNLLLFGTSPAYIYAVDGNTGQKRWKRRLKTGTPRYAPVVAPGRFAWPTSSGFLNVIERSNGKTVAAIKMKAPPLPGAKQIGTKILLSTTTGYLLSIDLMEGKERWRRRIHKRRRRKLFTRTAQLFNFRAAEELTAVLSLDDHLLICLDTNSGQVHWQRRYDGDMSLPPLLWGNKVFIGTPKRSLICLNIKGEVIWQTRARSPIVTAPIVDSDGVIYFVTANGFLQAVRVEPFLE
mgnify:CR=1 FL=1